MLDATTTARTIYAYDRADRLTAITAPSGKTTAMDYDDAGRRTDVAFGNGLVTKAHFETPLSPVTPGTTGRLKRDLSPFSSSIFG